MVDPYTIVRRLTGYELISPKDARLLTEAVDGLIGEIGSKDARIHATELFDADDALEILEWCDEAAKRIGELEAYAREATKTITGLTVGGSEFFGRQIGDIYTADLAYCEKRIRERMGYRCDQLKAQAERDALRARIAELEAALARTVAEADTHPFNPIGHVIEHVVPEARAALTKGDANG